MGRVLIVGAGPCGASLAWLLASRGIRVTLLERQRDFAREFRGEVLMPSGIEALQQMGLGDILTAVPSTPQRAARVYLGGRLVFEQSLEIDGFSARPIQAISQPALLESIVERCGGCRDFAFEAGATVKGLIEENGRIVGVRARTARGEREHRADLVIGTDGRASVVRRQGGFQAREVSPPLDVVWFKIPCPPDWEAPRFYAGNGHLLIALKSFDGRLQVAWVIVKGSFGALKRRPIEDWVAEMADHVSPDLSRHLLAHRGSVTHPFLLDAACDRVLGWSRPGALVLGDAAHTMSPVGGQGVNIALRDSVVAANHLVPVLGRPDGAAPGSLADALRSIERERMVEVRRIQRMQAIPPRVAFNQSRWGEPIRRVVFALLSSPAIRARVGARGSALAFGVTDVALRV
jgi:2-polyprenyl-6-methoxyphenol hydroxylase-like FAD-dependent oxidoreductase